MEQQRQLQFCNRRNIYFLCVIALNIIEFYRATGNGDVWKTAANCTGIVIMIIVASTCKLAEMRNLFNYIYTLIFVLAMILLRVHWRRHVGEYSLGQIETAILNIWMIGILAKLFFEKVFVKKEKSIRLSKESVLWFTIVVWSVLGNSERWWPLWFFGVFGIFYLSEFTKDDWNDLVNAICDGTIFSFFLIQGYAYIFRPYDMVRYAGAFANCNMMGLYYLIVYVMVLYKLDQLHRAKAKVYWKIFYYIGATGLQGFMFLTLSRTAWMSTIIVSVFFGLLVLRKHWKNSFNELLRKGCMFAVCTIIVFPLVYLSVRYLPTIHPHPIWYDGEYTVTRVHPWDPRDSDKYISMEEVLEEAFGRFESLFDWLPIKNPLIMHVYAFTELEENVPKVVEIIDMPGVDSSIRVRLSAAKTYLENSTWLGHSSTEENFIWETTNNRVWHSQNFWVQMTYTFGYPVGILFLVMTCLRLCKSYKIVTRENNYEILPFFIYLVFVIYGAADIVWNPGQLIFTLAFMMAHPQFQDSATEIKNV